MTEPGIDCSGLVHMSFRATGRLVPRDADQQEAAGHAAVAEPRPATSISYGDAGADHIAFWLGDGRILHSTRRDGVGRRRRGAGAGGAARCAGTPFSGSERVCPSRFSLACAVLSSERMPRRAGGGAARARDKESRPGGMS